MNIDRASICTLDKGLFANIQVTPKLSDRRRPLALNSILVFLHVGAIAFSIAPKAHARTNDKAISAKNSIVRIEGAVQGSGVILKQRLDEYSVLTAWHVLKPNRRGEEINIITHDGRAYISSIQRAKQVGSLDLAIINFSSKQQYSIASISNTPEPVRAQDPIVIFGYPNENPLKLTKSRGLLIANAEVGIDQGYQILYDSATSAGMSGGPVFDLDFNVVGIHGRGELDIKTFLASGKTTKTKINQGIPIYFYEQFNKGEPIKPKSQSATSWEDYLALLNQAYLVDETTGQRKIKTGQRQTAIRFIDQIIRLRPELSYAWGLKGILLSEIDPSIGQFNEYTNSSLKLLSAYSSMTEKARKLFYEDQIDSSLELFKYAVRFVHNIGAENHMYMALAYGQKGDYDAAIKESEKGIAIAANLYKRGIGITTLQPSDTTISEEVLDEMVIGSLYRVLGNAYLGKKEYQKAALTFDEYIEIAYSFKPSKHVNEALSNAYAGKATSTLFLTDRTDWACDYYSDAKHYGLEARDLESICTDIWKKSKPRQQELERIMVRLASNTCSDRGPYEPINFLARIDSIVLAIKEEPKLYRAFKSDSSLTAWAFTIAYKAFQICPQAFPIGAGSPTESFNYDGRWDHFNPRKY